MRLEDALADTLKGLACGGVYADGVPAGAKFPLIVYQVVGGRDFDYFEQKVPSHEHVRLQVTTWSTSRLTTNDMMRKIRKALVEGPLMAETYGSPVWESQPEMGIKGSRQDFGIWHRPDS